MSVTVTEPYRGAFKERIESAEAVVSGVLASIGVFRSSIEAFEKTIEVVENENGRIIERNRKLVQRVEYLEETMQRRETMYQTITLDGQELMLRAPIEAVLTLPPGTLGGGQSAIGAVERAADHIRQSNALSDVEILRRVLAHLLDRVDYTQGSRVKSDRLSYVLSVATIEQAHKALKDTAP